MTDRTDIARLGARSESMLAELATISAEPQRLIRLFLTPEHSRAADLVASWMREAGMSVTEDALGTVRGHWRPDLKRRLLIGSHIDTVIDAGKYDGSLGVVAGILAVQELAARNTDLPFGIDVLAFGDEEGSRFPATLTSSAACAGVFEPAALLVSDRNGTTLAQALAAYRKNADEIREAAYNPDDVLGYVEVHIEQGPVLETDGLPLGVVTGIAGQCRSRVHLTGEAGHAGTVPMAMRRDALAGAAELILAVERIARGYAADNMVATVGRIEARPGATNVIPGRVDLSLDLRSSSDPTRAAALAAIKAEAEQIGGRRNLQIDFELDYDNSTLKFSPLLQDLFDEAIVSLGVRPIRLPSGAGHDAISMSKLCPTAMLFVRCQGGISHNPAEFASEADMGLAVAALVKFIEGLASRER